MAITWAQRLRNLRATLGQEPTIDELVDAAVIHQMTPGAEISEEDKTAALFVQQKAQIGTIYANRLSDPNEDHRVQRKYYENVRNEILVLLDGIDDESYRGFAAHCGIKMCIAGGDDVVAKALLAGVRDETTREQIISDVPRFSATGGTNSSS